MSNIKAVIIDYGRTLHDHEVGDFFPETEDVLKTLHGKYQLALVSITSPDDVPQRIAKLQKFDLAKYFESIEVVSEKKEEALERAVHRLGVPHEQVAIVDDRAHGSIAWGNQHGCMTIWIQKGKFAQELPNEETGQPTYTIHELKELTPIL